MTDVSSLASSPSLYSHRGSHISHSSNNTGRQFRMVQPSNGRGLGVFADSDYDSEDAESSDHSRLSMLSGPRVRKYTDSPWGEEDDTIADHASVTTNNANGLSRMLKAAASKATNGHSPMGRPKIGSPTGSTMTARSSNNAEPTMRKGINLFNKTKAFHTSSSAGSIASSQTNSTAAPITPKLKVPFGSPPSPLTAPRSSATTPRANSSNLPRDYSFEETLLPIAKANAQKTSNGTKDQIDTSMYDVQGKAKSGIGLISLEQAQERERQKSHRRTGTAHQIITRKSSRSDVSNLPSPMPSSSGRSSIGDISNCSSPPLPARVIKPKKSGIMKLFNKDKSSENEAVLPKMPTPPLPSSLKSLAHGHLPGKSRPSIDTSVPSEVGSLHSATISPIPRSEKSPSLDKPLPPTRLTPPKKEAKKEARRGQQPDFDSLSSDSFLKPQPRLELRPISMNFSGGFAPDYLSTFGEEGLSSSAGTSPAKSAGPVTPKMDDASITEDASDNVKEQVANAKKVWRLQQFELEAQIRELKDQLEEAKRPKSGGCDACGCACGGVLRDESGMRLGGVMDRARVKTGGARGVFGAGNLYE